jgi:hypothetical protein
VPTRALARTATRPLGLWTDELVQDGHATAMRNGDIAWVRLSPADAEHLAVLAEEPPYVRRQVREEVARIGIATDPAAGKLDVEAIHRPAAVGVDKAAQELLGIGSRELPLPAEELDLAFVLASRPVLREGVRKDRVARLQDDDPAASDPASRHGNIGQSRSDCALDLRHHSGVRGVQADDERRGRPRRDAQASIAEVHAQQIAVCAFFAGTPRGSRGMTRRW